MQKGRTHPLNLAVCDQNVEEHLNVLQGQFRFSDARLLQEALNL